jgi:hypothetical protein
MKRKNYYMFFGCLLLLIAGSCKKLVDVPEPVNSLTTSETFSSDGSATSGVVAIYNDLTTGYNFNGINYGNGLTTYLAGVSADEFTYSATGANFLQFQNNVLQSNNDRLGFTFWNGAYFDIYMANAAIEALTASKTLTPATKNQLLGEAKFLRAYIYFYLVNLFGNVPLTTTSDFATNAVLKNTPSAETYQQMISDLKDAQSLMAGDYSVSGGERIRANKWAATALLARVYLYTGDWADAATQASAVIGNSGTYSLAGNLNNVFLKNSTEAIWQLKPNSNSNYATWEGWSIVNGQNRSYPTYDLTSNLLSSFEPNDQRKPAWTYSVTYSGITYYGVYKYKATSAVTSSSNIPEYYTMLRLAEQYLIRAEAEANGASGGTNGAINDLNTIRNRAGLSNLSTSLTQAQVIGAVAQERRIELFGEWGHRWFDLKRTGQAVSVLSQEKGSPISNNALLWPIPYSEIIRNPNLQQNPGY